MKKPLDAIRSTLTAQLSEIDQGLESAEGTIYELKKTRRQVVAAIRALGGDNGTPVKPAPKKAQVRAAIIDLLVTNGGSIDECDLEALVAERLSTNQGCSAVGLALRVREVLATDDFLVANGEVRQTKPQP